MMARTDSWSNSSTSLERNASVSEEKDGGCFVICSLPHHDASSIVSGSYRRTENRMNERKVYHVTGYSLSLSFGRGTINRIMRGEKIIECVMTSFLRKRQINVTLLERGKWEPGSRIGSYESVLVPGEGRAIQRRNRWGRQQVCVT